MQIPVFGSVYNMVKTMKLEMRWQQRKNNPFMEKGSEQDMKLENLRKQAEQARKSNAISAIDIKLKSGQKLSTEELEYLRVNSPQLYEKAIEIQKEREAYRKELEKCKSKEEVEKLHSNKVLSLFSQAKSVASNPNIGEGKKVELLEQITRRTMAINNEHALFLKTREYIELPQKAEDSKGETPLQKAVEDAPDKKEYPKGDEKEVLEIRSVSVADKNNIIQIYTSNEEINKKKKDERSKISIKA